MASSAKAENDLALQRCRARFRSLGPAPSPAVRLHAYTINSLGWWHLSVSVFGVEWSLDGYQNMALEQLQQRKGTFKGVQSSTLEPHEAMHWFMGGKPLYREYALGETTRSPLAVQAILEHLIENEYHAGWRSTAKSYKIATHNCQDFAQSFLILLLEPSLSAALIPPELLYIRDCARFVVNPLAWLGSYGPPPTYVRNETGLAIRLRVCGPTLTDWRADASVLYEHVLQDGESWEETRAPRVLRIYYDASCAETVDLSDGDSCDCGPPPTYETPCLGQRVRLFVASSEREQGDAAPPRTIEHANLLTISPPVLLW